MGDREPASNWKEDQADSVWWKLKVLSVFISLVGLVSDSEPAPKWEAWTRLMNTDKTFSFHQTLSAWSSFQFEAGSPSPIRPARPVDYGQLIPGMTSLTCGLSDITSQE